MPTADAFARAVKIQPNRVEESRGFRPIHMHRDESKGIANDRFVGESRQRRS